MPLPRQLLTLEGGDEIDGIREEQSSLTHPRDNPAPTPNGFLGLGTVGKIWTEE